MKRGVKVMGLFLAAVVLGGCTPGGAKKEISQMDFQAKMEFRAPNPAVGKRPRILFVGNSHTFYNDLAGTFARIANDFGQKSDVYELSRGYYSLKQYADPENEMGALFDKTVNGKKWDFVILQENSATAFSNTAEEEMFPYTRLWDEQV